MAGRNGPTTPWGPAGGGGYGLSGSRRQEGPTMPDFLDPEGRYGELTVLKMTGKNNLGEEIPLPLNPFWIRKSVENLVGVIEDAQPERGGQIYALYVRNKEQVTALLNMETLNEKTNAPKFPVLVTLYDDRITCRCVVTVPQVLERTEAELLEELADQKVKRVHRVMRDKGKEKTPTLILTVGSIDVPKTIYFGYNRIATRPYYPGPMQCYNCWAFGHTRPKCRQKGICGQCSGDHVTGPKETCNEPKFCKKCGNGDHALGSRTCPIYKKENVIQRIKTDRKCQYPEARRIYEDENRSQNYAKVTQGIPPPRGDHPNPPTQEFSDMSMAVQSLTETVRQKDENLSKINESLEAQRADNMALNANIGNLISQMTSIVGSVQQMQQQLAERDVTIAKQQANLDAITLAMKQQRTGPIDPAQPSVNPLQAVVDALQQQLSQRDQVIASLQNDIREIKAAMVVQPPKQQQQRHPQQQQQQRQQQNPTKPAKGPSPLPRRPPRGTSVPTGGNKIQQQASSTPKKLFNNPVKPTGTPRPAPKVTAPGSSQNLKTDDEITLINLLSPKEADMKLTVEEFDSIVSPESSGNQSNELADSELNNTVVPTESLDTTAKPNSESSSDEEDVEVPGTKRKQYGSPGNPTPTKTRLGDTPRSTNQ